jgi:hypothetical protein
VFSSVRDQPNVASDDDHITSDLGCVDFTHCGVKKFVDSKLACCCSSPTFRSAHSSYLNLSLFFPSMIFIYFASQTSLANQDFYPCVGRHCRHSIAPIHGGPRSVKVSDDTTIIATVGFRCAVSLVLSTVAVRRVCRGHAPPFAHAIRVTSTQFRVYVYVL